jgi:hypothetical protein
VGEEFEEEDEAIFHGRRQLIKNQNQNQKEKSKTNAKSKHKINRKILRCAQNDKELIILF